MSNDMKCQVTWNVKWHEMSSDMKCQVTWNVKWHEMSNDMKCQMTWNVKWYMIHDTWFMIHDSWFMIHDTWYMIHDTWYMIHDKWYMMMMIYCWTFLIFMLMLDLWPQAETPGVIHFGASPGRSFLSSTSQVPQPLIYKSVISQLGNLTSHQPTPHLCQCLFTDLGQVEPPHFMIA